MEGTVLQVNDLLERPQPDLYGDDKTTRANSQRRCADFWASGGRCGAAEGVGEGGRAAAGASETTRSRTTAWG